jgi:hypothetical protein
MNTTSNNPFVLWRAEHPASSLDAQTEVRIQQWIRVNRELLELFDQFDDAIEPWLEGRTTNEPDLVSFIAGYGYSRLVAGNWTSLPIDIPESEQTRWNKDAGLIASITELNDWQAGVSGSVADILHANTFGAIALIHAQLTQLQCELAGLVAKPLAEFAPTQWPDEMIGEEEVTWEIKDLDRIFNLYEQLICFVQGIEELRKIMITEYDEDLHLPNQEFYDALLSINSHELLETLQRAEPKLKQILKLWDDTTMSYSGKPYHRPYDKNAPAEFWWRHRVQHQNSRQRRPRRK